MKAEDKIGTIINGWKITGITGKDKNNKTLFEAVSTITGKTITKVLINNVIHNRYSHYSSRRWHNRRIGHIFLSMKSRCYNVKNKKYPVYGKRGITIYQEWLDNPQAFEEWAVEHGYQDNLTIDRINPNGNYEPSNCRWITHEENSRWTKNTAHIWIGNYLCSARGWSLKIGKYRSWFSDIKRQHGFNYAYQRLLEEIEKFGGIKKVMGVSEEHDIAQFLEDIENDCLEVDLVSKQLLEELKNVSDLLHAFSGYNEHTGIQGKKNLEIAIRCIDTLIDRVTEEDRGDKKWQVN